MSAPTWITPAGDLGIIPDEEFFHLALNAYNPEGGNLSYTVIAGKLPVGLILKSNGDIVGSPVRGSLEGVPAAISVVTTSTFTVRITNSLNELSDRTFSLTVTGVNPPVIVPKNVSLGDFYTGELLAIQLIAVNYNPNSTLVWEIVDGSLPPGVTFTSTGLLRGYIDPYAAGDPGLAGFERTPFDTTSFEYVAVNESQNYQFKVQVSDGFTTDLSTYTIYVYDNSVSLASTTELTADNDTIIDASFDNRNSPILKNFDTTLDPVRQGGYYAYKFDGFDFNFDPIGYSYTGVLPAGLSLNAETGWLSGVIPTNALGEVNYTFTVKVYKTDNPLYFTQRSFTLPLLGQINNTVVWNTDPELGVIDNGDISTFSVSAYTKSAKKLQYRIIYTDPYTADFKGSKLPQGLKMLPDGLIVGRVAFESFTLDSGTTTFDGLSTTFDREFKFTVEAYDPGVYDYSLTGDGTTTIFTLPNVGTTTADTRVTINGVVITPSVDFVVSVNKITFTSPPPVNSIIAIKLFVNFVSGVREFTIKVNNINLIPYENLYIRAFPSRQERQVYDQIINNTDVFPVEDIYRLSDPWFGKNTEVKSLFLTGLHPSIAAEYVNSMSLNHYWKNITISDVKTAQALDENFNVKYEVVYVNLTDNLVNDQGKGPVANLAINTNSAGITNVYPNSFTNMGDQMTSGIGYANRSILPGWMTSQQSDGKILGFTRALVLCYTKPSKSSAIAYRAQQLINQLRTVSFTIDRYVWDHAMSKNYSLVSNSFATTTPATGTITVNNSSSTVVGSGTIFPMELAENVLLTDVNNQIIGKIQTITSNNTMTLMANSTITATDIPFKIDLGETVFDQKTAQTTFDVNKTRFYENRVGHSDPSYGSQYLKFPNVSITTRSIV